MVFPVGQHSPAVTRVWFSTVAHSHETCVPTHVWLISLQAPIGAWSLKLPIRMLNRQFKSDRQVQISCPVSNQVKETCESLTCESDSKHSSISVLELLRNNKRFSVIISSEFLLCVVTILNSHLRGSWHWSAVRVEPFWISMWSPNQEIRHWGFQPIPSVVLIEISATVLGG